MNLETRYQKILDKIEQLNNEAFELEKEMMMQWRKTK